MCFLLHLQKNRVGRSLFIFIFFIFIFPDFTKKHNRCVVFCLHEVYNEKVSFELLENACPTVKAFHRMNLNQNKCLNSNTASNMTVKVAKPIKKAANRVGCVL